MMLRVVYPAPKKSSRSRGNWHMTFHKNEILFCMPTLDVLQLNLATSNSVSRKLLECPCSNSRKKTSRSISLGGSCWWLARLGDRPARSGQSVSQSINQRSTLFCNLAQVWSTAYSHRHRWWNAGTRPGNPKKNKKSTLDYACGVVVSCPSDALRYIKTSQRVNDHRTYCTHAILPDSSGNSDFLIEFVNLRQ